MSGALLDLGAPTFTVDGAPQPPDGLLGLLMEVGREIAEAEASWPPLNSAHEAYGIIAEEFRELEAWVFAKQRDRDPAEMRKEAIQLAATALRMVRDIVDGSRIRR